MSRKKPPNVAELIPKRLDLRYLRGWFQIPAKGNQREALRLALEYLGPMGDGNAHS